MQSIMQQEVYAEFKMVHYELMKQQGYDKFLFKNKINGIYHEFYFYNNSNGSS